MTAVKERILGAVSIMDESDAVSLWEYILSCFSPRSFDDIEEVEPDEWDIKMLKEIEADPDCREFVSSEDAMKEIGLLSD